MGQVDRQVLHQQVADGFRLDQRVTKGGNGRKRDRLPLDIGQQALFVMGFSAAALARAKFGELPHLYRREFDFLWC